MTRASESRVVPAIRPVLGWALPGLVTLVMAIACAPQTTAPAPYELKDVVAPALAAARARVPVATAPVTTAPVTNASDANASSDAREQVEGILGSLAGSDARLRRLATEDARVLSAAGVSVAARILADESEDVTRRVNCARILGEIARPDAGEALLVPLEKSRIAPVRAQCAFELGRVKQDQLLPRMLLRLKYEADGDTVIWLAHALSRHQNLAGIDGLWVLATTARDENVRTAAANMGTELATEFGSSDFAALRADWFSGALEARRPRVEPSPALEAEAWQRIATLSTWDLRQVDDARFVLVALGDWVVPHVVAALHDTNAYTRIHAAQVLERRGLRARAARAALIDALREPRLAPTAAMALGAVAGTGDVEVGAALVSQLRTNRDLDVKVAAARALGRLARSQARPNSTDPTTAGGALPGALEALTAAFATSEPADLRQAAAESLLELDGRAEAVQHLARVLSAGDGDPVGAEDALARYLERRAGSDEAAARQWAQWKALDVRAGDIATVAETNTRQRARGAALLAP